MNENDVEIDNCSNEKYFFSPQAPAPIVQHAAVVAPAAAVKSYSVETGHVVAGTSIGYAQGLALAHAPLIAGHTVAAAPVVAAAPAIAAPVVAHHTLGAPVLAAHAPLLAAHLKAKA